MYGPVVSYLFWTLQTLLWLTWFRFRLLKVGQVQVSQWWFWWHFFFFEPTNFQSWIRGFKVFWRLPEFFRFLLSWCLWCYRGLFWWPWRCWILCNSRRIWVWRHQQRWCRTIEVFKFRGRKLVRLLQRRLKFILKQFFLFF